MTGTLTFYLVAFLMLAGALATVTVPNILHAALALSGTFLATAVLYLMMRAEFVAVAQVLVYIGGVVIFAVFAILLTSKLGEKGLTVAPMRRWAGAAIATVLFLTVSPVLLRDPELPYRDFPAAPNDYSSLRSIGERLLRPDEQGFVLPFEIISLLLLVVIVGTIVLARRDDEGGDA